MLPATTLPPPAALVQLSCWCSLRALGAAETFQKSACGGFRGLEQPGGAAVLGAKRHLLGRVGPRALRRGIFPFRTPPTPAWTQCTCGQVPWPLETELCPLSSPQLSRDSGHGKIPFRALSFALKTALCQPIFMGRLPAWVSLLQGLPRPSSTLCTPGPDPQAQVMAASGGEQRTTAWKAVSRRESKSK